MKQELSKCEPQMLSESTPVKSISIFGFKAWNDCSVTEQAIKIVAGFSWKGITESTVRATESSRVTTIGAI